jgi:hypothetical protein
MNTWNWLAHTVDWGDAPTLLATVGAGIAAFFAYKAYTIERIRDERAEGFQRRDQAEKVAVWRASTDPFTEASPVPPVLAVRNASSLPVYSMQVFGYRWGGPDTATNPAVKLDIGLTPPGDAPRLFALPTPGAFYVYAVEFRDAMGVFWHRDRHGVLAEGRHPDGKNVAFVAAELKPRKPTDRGLD